LEVADDRALRRPVVVGRDDEEGVDAELVGLARQVHRVRRGVRAGACDHGRAVADGVDRGREELARLLVGEGRRLARGAGLAACWRGGSASSSSRSAKKIASEKVGYGWIVSTSTSTGVALRTARVTWPSHSAACGPTATAPTSTRSDGSAKSRTKPSRFGRS